MLDYYKIQEIFGAPLNTVVRPNVPFRLKPWHVVAVLVGGYIVVKGIKAISKDYHLYVAPKFKKESDLD
jgi:hypothetical protein